MCFIGLPYGHLQKSSHNKTTNLPKRKEIEYWITTEVKALEKYGKEIEAWPEGRGKGQGLW